MRITQGLDELRDDVRFAFRQLTLLRPLSFTDADRLVMLHERTPTIDRGCAI